ncbi:hypothetical protein OH492_13675 [Vibrio chagasii]|nr:hypothetical protein [Vibrio chagasii]
MAQCTTLCQELVVAQVVAEGKPAPAAPTQEGNKLALTNDSIFYMALKRLRRKEDASSLLWRPISEAWQCITRIRRWHVAREELVSTT